jgi:hypothetical protein
MLRATQEAHMSGNEQQVLEAPRPDETPKTWGEAIAAQPNPFAIAAARYVRAPIAFVREVLGAEPDPWQLEALRALAKGRAGPHGDERSDERAL